MKKKVYIKPFMELCSINADTPLLEIVNFNSLDPVGGGVINANIDEFWEEEEVEVKKASSLWD